MPNYQKMYTTLYNKVTDIINDLQKVQNLTEQMYIDSTPNLEVLEFPKEQDKKPEKNKEKNRLRD